MTSLNTDVEEFSVAEAMENTICYRGQWVDNDIKGFVLNVPTPSDLYFALDNAHLFELQWKKRRRLYVSVERKGTDKPEVAQVRAIDGKMIILKGRIGFIPQPGSCVALFLGWESKIVNEELLYEWQKRKMEDFKSEYR